MNAEYNESNLGDISINNDVIKNIALKAATDISGIHSTRVNFIKKMWNTLRKKDSATEVILEFINSSEIKITLRIMMEYGVNIPHLAGIAQENVKKEVEHMTGLTVTEVAVKIVEVDTEKYSIPKENPKKELEPSQPVNDEAGSQ